MTPQTQALQKQDKFTEFVPFGAQDKIKLSVDMVKNLIAVKTKSGKTCSDTDAIKFISMCLARRLNPFEGDAFLIGYDSREGGATFSLITAHQAFLKRAELNSEYDGMKSGIIIERNGDMMELEGDFFLEGDKVMGGWATVFFKNRKQPMHKRIRLQRFKKSFGIWMEDPAGMICKCAEADALRSSFPTMLGGLYLKEEMETQQHVKASTPIFSKKEAPIVDVPPAPEPAPEPPKPEQNDALVLIQNLCKKEKVDQDNLLEFLKAINLADDTHTELAQLEEGTLLMVVEQWEDFSKRVKEAS
jgi:phage recombination protein Bet